MHFTHNVTVYFICPIIFSARLEWKPLANHITCATVNTTCCWHPHTDDKEITKESYLHSVDNDKSQSQGPLKAKTMTTTDYLNL
jgi:hypothetical protein